MLIRPYKGDENYAFVSYSHRNISEVHDFIEHLQNNGYNIWYDEGIDPGTEWDENIANHINGCSYFIAFITNDYIKSQNCKDELNYARDLNKDRLLIYGEDVELPEGMKMRLSRLQAIFKYKYKSEQDFYTKVFETQGLESCKSENIKDAESPSFQIEQLPVKRNNNKRIALAVCAIILAIIIGAIAGSNIKNTTDTNSSSIQSESISDEVVANPNGDTVSLNSIEVKKQEGDFIGVDFVITNNTDHILREVHIEGEAYDKDNNILTKIWPGGQNTIKPGNAYTIHFVWDVENENSEYYVADVDNMKIYGYSYETDEGIFKYAFESAIETIPVWEPKTYTFNQ